MKAPGNLSLGTKARIFPLCGALASGGQSIFTQLGRRHGQVEADPQQDQIQALQLVQVFSNHWTAPAHSGWLLPLVQGDQVFQPEPTTHCNGLKDRAREAALC